MARAATTTDVFNAIAEARRREILELLARTGEQAVSAIQGALKLPQPTVSKHLAVLRRVGLVGVTRRGRQRVYELNATELKTVHDWTRFYERFWTDQLSRIKRAAEREVQRTPSPHRSTQRPKDDAGP